MIYTGVVENRQDPMQLGRCQVRVVGLHTDDKTLLPTADLPWAYIMQPTTSAAVSGIGYSPTGIVPGTWVVIIFRDEDQQQPIIIGTLGGIPQTKSGSRALDDSQDTIAATNGFLVDGSGNLVLDGSGNPIRAGQPESTNNPNNTATTDNTPKPAEKVPTTPAGINATIPTTPPPKSGASASASDGIKALIAACDKVGLTTKYAKCALLGIAGGESKWVPQKEQYTYNPTRLAQIFKSVTPDVVERYSYAPKKGMSREDFFSFFYGPSFRGKNFLGNKTDADGGKYYGRGFIQLTGRYNYERYNRLAKQRGLVLDIVNNPDSLDDDLETSALIAALYITDRVKGWEKSMYEPGFFQAAKAAVGYNDPKVALAKQTYYEYFLGGAEDPQSTNKNATATEPNLSQKQIDEAPADKKEAYSEDRSGNALVLGFTDPAGKYPLRDHMNESDTNRLARGVIEGTCFEYKDTMRKVNVPTADGGKWSQPLSSYNTVYPYNKVMETESGHIMEFDDSPDGERVHLYHRKGTFYEVDPNGSKTQFVVGDNYTIVLRNDNIYIVGSANLTVGGEMRILVQGDAKIDVEGKSKISLMGDAELGIGGNLDMTVGKDFQLKVEGDYKVQAKNIYTKTSERQVFDAAKNFEVFSSEDVNILASGNFNADYAEMQFANGLANVDSLQPIDLTPVEFINAVVPTFSNLEPPERSFEEIARFETPDDWETDAAKITKEEQFNNPSYKSPENKNGEAQEIGVVTGGSDKKTPVDATEIKTLSDFSPAYKLSKHFTIGQLVEPSVIIKDIVNPKTGKQYTKQDLVENLANLAVNICEPLYELLGPTGGKYAAQSPKGAWYINSGLRNGTGTSQHDLGQALDMRYNPKRSFEEMWKLAVQLEKILPYDQLILEYRKPGAKWNPGPGWMNWIHVSYDKDSRRKQAFTMIDDKSVNSSGVPAPGSRGLFLFGSD